MTINKLRLALSDIETDLFEHIGFSSRGGVVGSAYGDSTGKSYFNPSQKPYGWQPTPIEWSSLLTTRDFISAFSSGKVSPIVQANNHIIDPTTSFYLLISGNLIQGWEDIFAKAFGVDAQVFRDLFPKFNDYDNPVILDGIPGFAFEMPSNKSIDMTIFVRGIGINTMKEFGNLKRRLKRFFRGIDFDESKMNFILSEEDINMDIPMVPLDGESPLKKDKKKKKSKIVPVFQRKF